MNNTTQFVYSNKSVVSKKYKLNNFAASLQTNTNYNPSHFGCDILIFLKLSIFFTAWQGHTKLRKEKRHVLGPCCGTTRANAWYSKVAQEENRMESRTVIHTYIYIYTYHIWRKSFRSKTCYICHGHEAQYLFEWVIPNDHLQSSQGNRQLDHIFFVIRVANFLSLRFLCNPSPHMGQFYFN